MAKFCRSLLVLALAGALWGCGNPLGGRIPQIDANFLPGLAPSDATDPATPSSSKDAMKVGSGSTVRSTGAAVSATLSVPSRSTQVTGTQVRGQLSISN